MRRAGAVAHGPDAWSCGFEAVVDLDVAGRSGFDSDDVEAHVLRVGSAAGGDKEVRALEDGTVAQMECDRFAGGSFDAGDSGVGGDVDALVPEELIEAFDYVGVFAVSEGGVALDDGDMGAEAAYGLGELKPDEAATEDDEVLGKDVEFEGFDVRHGRGFGEAGDGIDGGVRAGVEEDTVGAEGAGATCVECDFDGFFSDEAAEAHDDLGVAFGVVAEVHVAKAVDHALAAGADPHHIDVPVAVDDAELGAVLEERGDFGGVDDVFAGQAGDVGAGAA